MANETKRSQYETDEIITVEFEEGEDLEVGIMGVFEVNGKNYIALEDLNEETDDVYIYGYIETEDGFDLEDIPDDVFEAVEKEFDALMSEEE